MVGRERSNFGFEEKAKLDEVVSQVWLARQQALEWSCERLLIRGTYEGTLSLSDLQVTEELEVA